MQAVLPAPSQTRTLLRRAPIARPAPRRATARVERRRNTSTLTLTRADDMSMLHSRLERSRDRRVTLILAPDARVLRRPLEYRVLRRLAEELGLEITIVSGDAE